MNLGCQRRTREESEGRIGVGHLVNGVTEVTRRYGVDGRGRNGNQRNELVAVELAAMAVIGIVLLVGSAVVGLGMSGNALLVGNGIVAAAVGQHDSRRNEH